jgi:LuxR family maltose regulon positive regulatory protein
LDEALDHYADARQLGEKYAGARSVTSATLTSLIAAVVYEQGDAHGAEIAILDDLDLIETTAFHGAFLEAYLVLVRAARCRGEAQRAISLLNRAERLAWERGWSRVVAALLLERVRLLVAEDRVDEAQSLLQPLQQLKADHPATVRCSWSDIHTYCTIAEGIIAGAMGHGEESVRLLGCAFEELLANHNLLPALRAGAEVALALRRSGKPVEANETLTEVLSAASQARVVGFLDHRVDLGELVAGWIDSGTSAGHGEVRKFAADLLTHIYGREETRPAAGSRLQRHGLTERECTIVSFIASGQSNKEIARTLGVAPETVKTHIKRIFVKLSAETRAQAVVRAQSMGLLRTAAGAQM